MDSGKYEPYQEDRKERDSDDNSTLIRVFWIIPDEVNTLLDLSFDGVKFQQTVCWPSSKQVNK